jgi:predicted metal-dependent HD superfamily phosphohydrolase
MSPSQLESLRAEWLSLFRQREAAELALADVERRYGEESRHYHTLDHVHAVLDWFIPLWYPSKPAKPLVLAAWLHDVIYDPRSKDNEERSAEYAHETLAALGVKRDERDEVARLILLTRKHETTPDDKDGQVLLDADLAVLGADQAEYDAYAAAIRREYHWVSDDDYRAGRRAVLQRFLARPRIFNVPVMHTTVEPRARANLAREIASLGG